MDNEKIMTRIEADEYDKLLSKLAEFCVDKEIRSTDVKADLAHKIAEMKRYT